MQHRLVVKTRSVESYSDSTPSSVRQTTTSFQLGLRSSSTCNKGSNRWLRNNNLILLSVIFHYLLFETVTLETNRKQNLGESESRTQLQLWSPLICQKTEFLLNCSILWQCSSALHHHLHCHSCSLEASSDEVHTDLIQIKGGMWDAHFSPHWKSINW